jgi:hypothetical protein
MYRGAVVVLVLLESSTAFLTRGHTIAKAARPGRALASYNDKQLTLSEAQAILNRFDAGHTIAAHRGAGSPGGAPRAAASALAANAYAATQPREVLAEAVRTLLSHAAPSAVRLGICTPDGASAVATLRSWVESLGLPRGTLYGADANGTALPIGELGASYIKYTARGATGADGSVAVPPGSAKLSAYGGSFRGVTLVTERSHLGLLPLGLFDESLDAADPGTSGLWAAKSEGVVVPVHLETSAARGDAASAARFEEPVSDYVSSQLTWAKKNAKRRANTQKRRKARGRR